MHSKKEKEKKRTNLHRKNTNHTHLHPHRVKGYNIYLGTEASVCACVCVTENTDQKVTGKREKEEVKKNKWEKCVRGKETRAGSRQGIGSRGHTRTIKHNTTRPAHFLSNHNAPAFLIFTSDLTAVVIAQSICVCKCLR